MIPSKVVEKVVVCRDVAHIYLKLLKPIVKPTPGQFVMVWVPGYEEIPMSVSDFSDDILRITVKCRGPTTNYLVRELPVGSYLGVRGPYGKGVTEDLISGKGLFIVGGIGIAPILYLVKYYRELIKGSKLLAGFVSRDESKVTDELINYLEVDMVSEDVDGATVIDLLKKYLPSINNYDYYLVSGPKAVLDQVVNLVGDSLRGYILTESLMKCGLGFCGSCALKDFLVCRDGTLVDASRYRWLIS